MEKEAPYTNNLFSNHFLEERLQNLEEWEQAEVEQQYEKIQGLWDTKKTYLQNKPNEDNTQEEWINKILTIIGHQQWGSEPTKTIGNGRNLNPDYLFFKDFETKLDAEESDNQFEEGYLIGEAKKYGRILDKSMDNHENPSFQIFNYVDRLRTPWGLLTNGKKWRLYSYEDCEADTFYEIDIVEEILEKDRETALQNFKYFYLFFRQESFLPKENSFLNKVYEGSENYAQGIEEDLEDAIYTALEETARGFFETNDIEMTEENIEEVHHSSLILLYRFLFILNAESRELLPVKEDRYESILSIEFLKEQLLEDKENVFTEDTWLWEERIEKLFESINEGREYGDFKITAYNGGLFDEEKHPFLAQNQLQGNHVRRILELLAESEDEETGEKVLVDYRDLNIRHLGSIYEGLLEHELREAEENLILENGEWKSASKSKKDFEDIPTEKKVEEGEVYLTNESGERKATGSYYTPEYIVEYIVENTIGPKVEEKIEESSQEKLLDNVLELNVCDPAMGSGHFLTEATSFIARRVLEHGKIEEEKVEGENEFIWVKRQVVSHCIYGVDINPLAVELGKLSLWIETMAEGKPLNFLDHHLKHGNSLIGSDFEEIFSHPTEKQKRMDSDRWRHIESPEKLKKLFRKKYKRIEEHEEETKEDVHEKEDKYKEFLDSTIYRQIKQLANIHTRQYFEEEANSSDYEDFIVNIGLEDNAMETMDWFKSAQQDAETKNYFHWEIEFPEVFFGQKEGFDAIVGNPPYVSVKDIPEELRDFLKSKRKFFIKRGDLYISFLELADELIGRSGKYSYIIPYPFLNQNYAEDFRNYLLEERGIDEIVDLSDYEVFEDATVRNIIFTVAAENKPKFNLKKAEPVNNDLKIYESKDYFKDEFTNFYNNMFRIGALDQTDILNSIEDRTISLGEIAMVKFGARGKHSEEKKDPDYKKMLKGKGIRRYRYEWTGKYLIYKDEELYRPAHKALFENDKLVISYVTGEKGLRAAIDRNNYYSDNSVTLCLLKKELEDVKDQISKRKVDITEKSIEKSKEYTLDTLLPIINSSTMNFYFKTKLGYDLNVYPNYVEKLRIPHSEDIKKVSDRLEELSNIASEIKEDRSEINLNIEDYIDLDNPSRSLQEFVTPVEGVSNTKLSKKSSDLPKLKMKDFRVVEEGNRLIQFKAKYKEEGDYTETDYISAYVLKGDKEAQLLVEETLKKAFEKGSGYCGFRDNAANTISLLDRLREVKIPDIEKNQEGLRSLTEQKEKAEELEEKIEKTDQEINEIVYDLYDLTEEEIEIVEESV